MITVERRIPVDRPAGEVLRYLADFGNAVAWDPGTESCTRIGTGPVAVGACWRNVSRFRGRRTELTYCLEEYGPGRLLFVGRNRTVTSTDDIAVRPAPSGSVVVYRAQLRFKGAARLASPFLRPAFERLADGAARQLPAVLARPHA
ncbi:SRPBCC family protein [Kitasatospora sp. NPDC054939]